MSIFVAGVIYMVCNEYPAVFSALVSLSPIIAAVFALFIAGGGGQYLKPLLGLKPELKFFDVRLFDQNGSDHWRVALKNIGNVSAKNVQCDVTKVTEGASVRENFVAVPLRWTHRKDDVVRDIVREQTAWLDVMIFEKKKESPELTLSTPHSGGVRDFMNLNEATEVRLTVYLENGKSFNQSISITRRNTSSVEACFI